MGLNRGEMLTWSGHMIHLDCPSVEKIYLEDISHPLSQLCRYSGGTVIFYSVAQHSLNAYRLSREFYYDEKTQLYLLLHDASEAYLSDLPTPVKKLLPGYLEMEGRLMESIHHHFGLEVPDPHYQRMIDMVDSDLLAYEIPALIPNLEEIKPDIPLLDIELDFQVRDPDRVRLEFEETVKKLVKKL